MAGPLSITAPATAGLGSAAPGGAISSGLGNVQVDISALTKVTGSATFTLTEP